MARDHDRAETADTVLTPDICANSFSADNNDTVNFKNIPSTGATITQISTTSPYPFVATGTNANGLKYTTVAAGGSVTISVPSINRVYYYSVSCCQSTPSGGRSVTVGSK